MARNANPPKRPAAKKTKRKANTVYDSDDAAPIAKKKTNRRVQESDDDDEEYQDIGDADVTMVSESGEGEEEVIEVVEPNTKAKAGKGGKGKQGKGKGKDGPPTKKAGATNNMTTPAAQVFALKCADYQANKSQAEASEARSVELDKSINEKTLELERLGLEDQTMHTQMEMINGLRELMVTFINGANAGVDAAALSGLLHGADPGSDSSDDIIILE